MKNSLYVVQSRTPDRLQIRILGGPHLIPALAVLSFCAAWYWVLLDDASGGALKWLFFLLPLVFFWYVLGSPGRMMRLALRREIWILDRESQRVTRGGRSLGAIADFAAVRVRVRVYEGRERCRVDLMRIDGTKVLVEESGDRSATLALADELADFLGVDVQYVR